MTDAPMDLIRKLDELAASLLELARRVRAAAEEVTDPALRAEMLESAEGWEQRAGGDGGRRSALEAGD